MGDSLAVCWKSSPTCILMQWHYCGTTTMVKAIFGFLWVFVTRELCSWGNFFTFQEFNWIISNDFFTQIVSLCFSCSLMFSLGLEPHHLLVLKTFSSVLSGSIWSSIVWIAHIIIPWESIYQHMVLCSGVSPELFLLQPFPFLFSSFLLRKRNALTTLWVNFSIEIRD